MPLCDGGIVYLTQPINTMSELELQLTKLIDKVEENKKAAAWGNFGKILYQSEIKFQLLAQQIINNLITPGSTDQIEQAELALATVKKELKALTDSRKAVTSARFDPVTERLMKPEKDITAAVEKATAGIIKMKKQLEEEQKTTEAKDKELKQIAAYTRTYVADMHAAYLNAQAKLISDCYKHALENNISMQDIAGYILKVKARINIGNRTTLPPKPEFKYNDQAAVDAEVKKHFAPWSAQQYIDGFNADMDAKFADWEVALKNKETAAELDAKELAETVEAIADQKESETIAAKLEAIAAPIEAQTTKPLKQLYKLPEPETMAAGINIINAYISNRKLCEPHVRKIKPVNFGVKQMMDALEAVKNQDENFAVTGINFITIEKL